MSAESLLATGQSNILIYLHGFNSSPQAAKAQVMLRYLQTRRLAMHFWTPWMPVKPARASSYLRLLVEDLGPDRVALIGSSMGGYYAAWLAEKYDLRCVLVNPAVKPYVLMQQYLGQNRNDYSGQEYELVEQDIDDLRAIEVVQTSRPENLLLMVQTGDETLDYREAVDAYQGCRMIIEEGGSHHFDGFENHLPDILAFLKIAP